MSYQYANDVRVKLAKSLLAASTTIDFVSATGIYNNPPTPTGGKAVLLKLVNRLVEPTRMEIISYTGKTGNQLTGVARGLNGTTARDWAAAGYLVEYLAIEGGISTEVQDALDLKLDASAYSEHWKGTYASLSALNTAHPTANDGDRANVDAGIGISPTVYVWDTTDNAWTELASTGSGATDTDGLPEGSTNLYFTEARVRAAVLTGLSAATVAVISTTDSVLSALGKLQAQILGINKVFHIQLANAGTTIPTGLIDYELINTAWNRTITGWYVKARGSSTGSIVLSLLINGSSAATITLSSANSASSLSIAWSVSDVITLSVTSGNVDFFELQLITERA